MYRIEAVRAQHSKLYGDVFLAQPVSFSIITVILVVIFALVVGFILTGSYARTAHVLGHLVPSKGMVKIQTSQYGELEKLFVREGDQVKAGAKLALVKLTWNTSAGLSPIDQSLEALLLQLNSIDAQIVSERNQLSRELTQVESALTETRANIDSIKQRILLQSQITASTKKSYENVQLLVTEGIISKLEFERLHQTWLMQQAEQKQLEQSLIEVQEKAEQLHIQLAQLPDQTEQRIAQLRVQKAAIGQQQADIEDRRADLILSPVDGAIVAISNPSTGRSVSPGQPLLSILPAGSNLEAELFVSSSAAGFIEPDQEVRLLYDAFPYQRFGAYPAVITRVTQTILSPTEVAAPFQLQEPVYRVTARLHSNTVTAKGKTIALQSGMTLKANIVLERRTFLEWLLEPLQTLHSRL